MRRFAAIFFATILLASSQSLHAQVLRGVVLDRSTRQPIEGAMAWLYEGEVRRAGVLSDAEGRFFVRAPAPGSYVVKVERIGYATAVSGPIDVPAAGYVDVELEASQHAISLDELQVEGVGRCDLRPSEGLETARVWDEVRKALEAAQWANDQELYHYDVVRFDRKLDPSTLRVVEETRRARTVVARDPIRSAPVGVLESRGYIQGDEVNGWTFYGPDPQVLLSDEFLDTHCFRLREGSGDQRGLLGLVFEPVRERVLADITGVLWLDPRTGELRFIDYRYTRLPLDVVAPHLGGRIDLERLPNGAWIVRNWHIRMPVLSIPRSHYPGRPTVSMIHETGGLVVDLRPPRRRDGVPQ